MPNPVFFLTKVEKAKKDISRNFTHNIGGSSFLNTMTNLMSVSNVAPVRININGTGETETIMNGVRVIQGPDSSFSGEQLDIISKILNATPPAIRSRITYIKAVSGTSWGGENLNGAISLNVDSGQHNRSFEQLVAHEIGHTAFGVLSNAQQFSFNKLHSMSKTDNDFMTGDYPNVRTNAGEDFADMYMTYLTDPFKFKSAMLTGSSILQEKIKIFMGVLEQIGIFK